MSRFAQRCRVLYIDPPVIIPGNGESLLWEQQNDSAVRVIRPLFADKRIGAETRERDYEKLWSDLLPEVLAIAGTNTIIWNFAPQADYLVAAALPQVKLAVYDCMDDLASFKDGTEEMRKREDHLLSLVDLLFTGGRSMYESRKDRHPRAYCFPSGVDVEHYKHTRDPQIQEPAAIAEIPHPRLGYFGVLDERIDWELIAAVARERPQWHWTLVGPFAKVEPEELPAGSNIHYLGQQEYADLPAFLKGFDIATMPFALNEATRVISPTKTPEYLAGGKPVISTSVPDVVATYDEVVEIADGADTWITTIEQMLAWTDEQRQERLERAAPLLEQSSWDSVVERMWALMQERLAEKAAIGSPKSIAGSQKIKEHQVHSSP
jgi:glycosyltransferase involved in cell wall biosynthesis